MDPIGNRRYVVVPIPYVLAAVLAGLAIAILFYVYAVARDLGNMTIGPIVPKQSAWHPNATSYCNVVAGLQGAKLLDAQNVALAANSAPNAQTRDAVLRLYGHVLKDDWTTSEVDEVAAAYPCPAP
jgi:hypothetical protein